jgi:outer membrane receptor protein involved in Fe transport
MTIGNFEDTHSVQGRAAENIDRYPYAWYKAVKYHGVRAQYYVNDTYSGYFGIDNLENTRPPLGLLGTTSGDPYDNMGRYFYLGINAKLK